MFGDLRSLAHRTPSRENFQRLLEAVHVAQVPNAQVEAEWVPYLEGHLSDWPEDTRACGKELIEELERAPVPWARLVRTLDYNGAHLGRRRVRALASAEHVRHITRLDLRASRITWPLLEELVSCAPFDHLKAFAFRKSGTPPETLLRALFESPMLDALAELNFSQWGAFTGKQAMLMVDHLPLDHLERLDLHGTRVTRGAISILCKEPAFPELRALDLSGLPVIEAARDSMLQATHMERLEELSLGHTGFVLPDEPLPTHLSHLRHLDLRACVHETGLRGMLRTNTFPNLETLNLSGNHLPDTELRTFLERRGRLPALETLDLSESIAVDLGALEHANLPELRRLHLSDTQMRPGTWSRLASADVYPNLTHISLPTFGPGGSSSELLQEFEATPWPRGLVELCGYDVIFNPTNLRRLLRLLEGVDALHTLAIPQWHMPQQAMPAEVLEALLCHPAFQEVRVLDLSCQGFSIDQSKRMIDAFPRLERLHSCQHEEPEALDAFAHWARERGVEFNLYD